MAAPATVNGEFDDDPAIEDKATGNLEKQVTWEGNHETVTHEPGDLPADSHHFSMGRGASMERDNRMW